MSCCVFLLQPQHMENDTKYIRWAFECFTILFVLYYIFEEFNEMGRLVIYINTPVRRSPPSSDFDTFRAFVRRWEMLRIVEKSWEMLSFKNFWWLRWIRHYPEICEGREMSKNVEFCQILLKSLLGPVRRGGGHWRGTNAVLGNGLVHCPVTPCCCEWHIAIILKIPQTGRK